MLAEHLAILRCPLTGQELRLPGDGELDPFNCAVSSGTARHVTGEVCTRPLESALMSRDGSLAYRHDEGILHLLPELALCVREQDLGHSVKIDLTKRSVQQFYDQVGWNQNDAGDFADAVLYEDLRPVAREYIHRCHMRVRQYLPAGGRYLLDVASGPVQYDEYLTYSRNFEYRICADLSISALRQARRRVGERGLFLLADITNLPIATGALDCAISLHTIYHVPREQQPRAFAELHRVIRPGSRALVVYTWGDQSPLMRFCMIPSRFHHALRRAGARVKARLLGYRLPPTVQDLYFNPFSPHEFISKDWPFQYRLVVWRSLSVHFMRVWVKPWLAGRIFLRFVYFLEERMPEWLGRVGTYPIIVIEPSGHPEK